MRIIFVAVLFLALCFSTVVAARVWDPVVDLYNRNEHLIRARKETTTSSSTRSSSASKTSTTSHATTTSEDKKATVTSSATETSSRETDSATTKSEKSSSSKTSSSISVDPRSPVGGVSMVTPAITDSETYIRIGEYATFSWNYTSLIVTPSAVNVEAYCSMNDHYYPIAANLSAEHTKVVWNTSDYQSTATIPLLTAEYTLYIYDASGPSTAIASAGYLGVYDSLIFGVYSPQAYTPLSDFQCSTCSAALSLLDRHVLRSSVLMAFIMASSAIVFMMR